MQLRVSLCECGDNGVESAELIPFRSFSVMVNGVPRLRLFSLAGCEL